MQGEKFLILVAIAVTAFFSREFRYTAVPLLSVNVGVANELVTCVPILHYRYRCLFIMENSICITVPVLVMARYSNNLVCNDFRWNGKAGADHPQREDSPSRLRHTIVDKQVTFRKRRTKAINRYGQNFFPLQYMHERNGLK